MKLDKMHCSFCLKSQVAVKTLITGPSGNICNECVQLCIEILKEEKFLKKEKKKRESLN